MRTLNLSGFKALDSLSISVAQGGLTAGPYSVSSWGGGGGGGTITIVPERTDLQCAPDSVRFTVDLSASTFDTVPGSNPPYDARLHDLIYLWDMDDTAGDWTAPINVLAAWKDRNVAKGPFVAHMYTQPGTYNPSVLVIEPSSGKTATASVSVTVADPDVVFAGAKTICVSTSGNFAGAPAGAATVTASTLTTDSAPYSTYKSTTEPRRWLLCRGETFAISIGVDTVQKISIGAYGTGDRPIVTPPAGGHCFTPYWAPAKVDIRIYDIACISTFDPTLPGDFVSGRGHGLGLFFSNWQVDLMISNVLVSGCMGTNIYHGPTAEQDSRYHLDDCVVTNFGGQYPAFSGKSTAPESSTAITGTRISQNPNAIDGNHSYGSCARLQGTRFTHVRGCDFFNLDRLQRCLKLIETPEEDGCVVNVHSCSLEGGLYNMSMQGNYSEGIGRTIIANAVIDGVICVGTYSTVAALATSASGYTVRNCLFIQPGIPKVAGVYSKFIAVGDSILTGGDLVYGAAPIRIYNNTGRMDRTTAQNGTNSLLFWEDSSAGRMSNVVVENNVIHAPNLDTSQTSFAPLSEAVLWTPRCIGYTYDFHVSPAQTLGSAVVDDASVTVAYFTSHMGLLDQADFAGTLSRASVTVGGTTYREADGQIAVTYGASNISVQNTSGVTWSSGASLTLTADTGTTTQLATAYLTPTGAVKDTKPLPGSAALGAALTGNVSYMDILGTTRTAPADKGAWVA